MADVGNSTCGQDDPKWYYFLSGSAVALIGGLCVLLAVRLLKFICARTLFRKRERKSRPSSLALFYLVVKRQCELITSNHSITGKVMSGIYVGACLGSFIIYIHDADDGSHLEVCLTWYDSSWHTVDAAFNIFFLLHFILRFVGARDKVMMWINILSIIDHFTLVPMFMSFYLRRSWLGLRFLRVFGLVGLSNLLQAWRVMKEKETIRLAQLVSFFVAVWLAGAGFVHLLESLGNFWTPADAQKQLETYWTWVYFLMVTMSTVGYGDFSASTVCGRIFVLIFIITAISMFASFIPEISEAIAAKKAQLHMIAYKRQYGEEHVVVCGHITPTIMKTFLKDFLNKDRVIDDNLRIIVLKPEPPDLEMESLLRKYMLNVIYIQGSVFNVKDLQRARIREASACVILSNKQTSDPVEEDAEAVMRVIAIKDFDPDIRIIVQLIQYQHKSHLLTIPNWRPKSGDKVVCLSELMLGFMAQNCLAPGFSTLLANLFTLTSYDDSSAKFFKAKNWQELYKRSAAFEMYTSRFSDSFHGMTFREAARVCYRKFDLLLLAISGTPENQGLNEIIVNPVDDKIIDAMTEGFFIAQSESDAAIVEIFCMVCHSGMTIGQIKPGSCKCEHDGTAVEARPLLAPSPPIVEDRSIDDDDDDEEGVKRKQPMSAFHFNGDSKDQGRRDNSHGGDLNRNLKEVACRNVVNDDITEEKFDCTGLFHWCPDRPMEAAMISHQKAKQMDFSDHVVLCLFAEDDSPLLGLCSFIMPLRASNISYKDLKPVVIVGNTNYIQTEWTNIMNFPKLYIVSNSYDGRDPLIAAMNGVENAIKIGNIQSAPLCRAYLRAVNIFSCSMCVILNAAKKAEGLDLTLSDKEAILCTLNIKTMPKDLSVVQRDPQQEEYPGERVMTITELMSDENVQYLEQDDDTDDCEIFMAQPYACGRVFTSTLLDSLMSTTYHNPNALAFIRAMVTGGVTSHIEQIYAEGMGLLSGEDINYRHYMYSRNRPSMCQYPIDHQLFGPHRKGCNYGDLVLYAMNTHGILVLGLYRLLHPTEPGAFKRCVITHPPPQFTVTEVDMVFCIQPFSITSPSSPTDENLEASNVNTNATPPAETPDGLEMGPIFGGIEIVNEPEESVRL